MRPEVIRELASESLQHIHAVAQTNDASPQEVLSAALTLANWVIAAAVDQEDPDNAAHNRKVVRDVLYKLLLHTAEPGRVA